MYRCVALEVQNTATDPNNAHAVGKIAREVKVVIERDAAKLNGVDVSTEIRSSEINGIVSIIAAHTPVRDAMREQQRLWIRDHQGGVVEGRDIGTVVFPDADIKLFLTASLDARSRRRVVQSGVHESASAEVTREIADRDARDMGRAVAPLRKADDAIEVDTTHLELDQVIDLVLGLVTARRS
jgi:cytidylate kinase